MSEGVSGASSVAFILTMSEGVSGASAKNGTGLNLRLSEGLLSISYLSVYLLSALY